MYCLLRERADEVCIREAALVLPSVCRGRGVEVRLRGGVEARYSRWESDALLVVILDRRRGVLVCPVP